MRHAAVIALSVFTLSGLLACANDSTGQDEGQSVEQDLSAAEKAKIASAVRGGVFFIAGFPNTHGNGRTCATCHVPFDAFGLTPANAEARYQYKLAHPGFDDPLFRSIDANDGAENYTNLRKGLIKVVLPLPVDAAGNKKIWPVDDPTATSVGVWRGVPTVLNAAITAPYQQDGRMATLQQQATGALHDHSQITNDPPASQLDDVANFQSSLFSSPQVANLAKALAAGQPPPATDPPLNELETQGKAAFVHHCSACHGGPTLNKPAPGLPPNIRGIMVSKPVPPPVQDLPFLPSPTPPRLWAIAQPNGAPPVIQPSTDPGIALLTGNQVDFNAFDMPTLHGISKTAPYFHDNSAATLEDVMHHYQSFFLAARRLLPPTVPPPVRPDEIPDSDLPGLLAYLRKL